MKFEKDQPVDFRNAFFGKILELAKLNSNLVLLTGDIGAHALVKFNELYPNRIINTGLAEQNMINVASGLAMNKKKVFAFSMTPFITLRCFEQIKINICSMKLPVTLVGLGTGFSFERDGATAQAVTDIAIMRTLPELTILNPSDPVSAEQFAEQAYQNNMPTYVRLDKSKVRPLYESHLDNFQSNFNILAKGKTNKLCLISTGVMVHKTIELSQKLSTLNIDNTVLDFYKIKPLNLDEIRKFIKEFEYIATIEEHSFVGGLGSLFSEIICDGDLNTKLIRFGLKDEQCFEYGDREWLLKRNSIDVDSIYNKIIKQINS